MRINGIDIIIVLLLISGFITGYKKGFIKQVVSTVGLIISVVLAFMLKNNLSIILYEKCPFFTVGLLKNYSSLNILLYELIAFFIIFILLSIILKIIIKLSGKLEDLFEESTVFKIPLKILGGILGTVESYVAIFIILLVFSLPILSVKFRHYTYKSKLANQILNNTFLISNLAEPLVNTIESVGKIEIQSNIGKEEFNCKTIEVFKKNKIISEESIKYLEKNKKIDKCK
jgi:uncharacterized membrane protein required for colicin V production